MANGPILPFLGGGGSSSPGTYAGTLDTAPRPYIEPDKSSKTASLLTGISSVLTTAANIYKDLKYNPKPGWTVSPSGSFVQTPGPQERFVTLPASTQLQPLIMPALLIGGLLLIVFAFKK